MKTLLFLLLLAPTAFAQSSSSATSLTGEWQLSTTMLGIRDASRLMITQLENRLQGDIYSEGDHIPINGAVEAGTVHFSYKIGKRETDFSGSLHADAISGTLTMTGKEGSATGMWSAKRAPQDKPAAPRNLEFNPTEFHRVLSADVPPVMRIWPKDVVHTKSVDAGGQDEKSVYRFAGGNPLTGPFYVEGTMPGDVIAITIRNLRLNRDWAISDSGLVDRALTTGYASGNKLDWSATRWHLDLTMETATLENAPANLKNFSVKLRPMLGCVGVAPGPGDAAVSTLDSGYFGGNMDFSGVAQGTTVYLRVHQPGALLYVGDAHAVQGDGELNGDALETSMDIEFTTDVLREKYIGTPRAENADYLMAIGLAGSLDDAFRKATSELAGWLQSDYKLTSNEAAVVLGTSVEYNISEVADRNAGVVAKIQKARLASLPHAK